MDYTMFSRHRDLLWMHSYSDTVKSVDSLFDLFTQVNVSKDRDTLVNYITNTPVLDIPISLRKDILVGDKYLDYSLYINYDGDDFEMFVNTVVNKYVKRGCSFIVADVRGSKAKIVVLTIDDNKNILNREDSEHVIESHCCIDYLVEKEFIKKVFYMGNEYYEMTVHGKRPVKVFFETNQLSNVEII